MAGGPWPSSFGLVGRQGLFLQTSSLPSSPSGVNSWGPSEASWDALVEGEVVDLRADLNVVVVLLVLDPDGTYRLVVVGEGYRDCEP
ncbi:MAG TPA: hypothetical protein RMF84_02255 [Polyangiaceae bacterium LLY-WYZ-14_1]|nr:hypothetical protein [Polyangiaceae bacterium LLY-WYZ-14_1]